MATLLPKRANWVHLDERGLLIVNLSTETRLLTSIRQDAPNTVAEPSSKRKRADYRNTIHVSPMDLQLLPDRWWYLEAADYVTESNDEDGVGRVLRDILKGEPVGDSTIVTY